MDTIGIILLVIFLNAIIAIAFEHSLGINKSWIALFSGTVMWMIASIGADHELMHHALAREFC